MGNIVDYSNAIETENIDTIYITGGGYVNRAFKGIGIDSAMGWEETVWGGDLTRSANFVLTNIEEVDFGLVARVEVSYRYMNVQDYIALCAISKQRVCTVNYYSRDLGKRVIQEMTFTGNEIKKLHTYGSKYLGNIDVKIKLVATNRDKAELIKSTCTITYNNNGGSGTIEAQSGTWSENKILSNGEGFTKSGSSLKKFNTKADGTGWSYLPNQHITLFGDLTLYAIWEANNG